MRIIARLIGLAAFTILLLIALSATNKFLSAQEFAFEVYTDANYGGNRCISDGPEANNIHPSCNDQVSSIRLQPGWSVMVFKDVNQGGASRCLIADDANLTDNTFTDGTSLNDAISSYILYDQPNCEPTHSFEVYRDADYAGNRCYSDNPGPDNVYFTCDNNISSLLLKSGWSVKVFQDTDQNGPSRCLPASDANLTDNTFNNGSPLNDAISSFILYDQPDCEPAYPLEVYNNANYSGTWCFSINPGPDNVYTSCNNNISSLLLRSGWSMRVYQEQNQLGTNACLDSSDADLSNNTFDDNSSMNNAISSFILYEQATCPPPPAPELTITKTAPFAVMPGALLTYTLTVTNSGNLAAANLLITDTIPPQAHYVAGGTPNGNTVRWSVASLPAGSSLARTFSVTAAQTITNSDYRVSATGNYSAAGSVAVVTAIFTPSQHPVLVLDENSQPVSGASVYYSGKETGSTNGQGICTFTTHLSGNNTLAALQLVYEQPTTKTVHNPDGGDNFAFRVYRTTMPIGNDGSVNLYTPSAANQPHILRVGPSNALVLFNIVVSIEWDANQLYIDQVKEALERMSDMLYNAADGQMALGWATVYDQAQHWEQADIQILAHNQVRPHAYVGGINTTGAGALSYKGRTFQPGHIILGRYWNGYGGNIGPWNNLAGYATILHEFGHYGLFLFDEYFYYEQRNGNYIYRPSRCSLDDNDPFSLMYNQYLKTEFCNRPEHYGLPTRQTQVYGAGESSWVTMKGVFSDALQASGGNPPWSLIAPLDRGVGVVPGPSRVPLKFLQAEDNSVSGNAFTKPITVTYQGQPVEEALTILEITGATVSTLYQGLSAQDGAIDILGAHLDDRICARTRDIGLDDILGACLIVQDANPETLPLRLCAESDPNCPEIGPGHKWGWTGGPGDPLNLIAGYGNLTLDAPSGVFAGQTEVTVAITNVSPTLPPTDTIMVGQRYVIEATEAGGATRDALSAAVITHSQKVMALTLAYHADSLGLVDERTLQPYYYNSRSGVWEAVMTYTLNITANEVSASTQSFGLYTLMGRPNKLYLPLILR